MDFFYNKPTLQDKLYGRIIFQLCSSKISTWSMKSTSVTRQSWWPCLDREIFGVVLHSALPTAVSCLNYTRRKTKSKNPVKKCFFFYERSLARSPAFWWNCLNWLPHCRVKNQRFREFCFYFCVLRNEEELKSQKRAVKASKYFNVFINGEIQFISI